MYIKIFLILIFIVWFYIINSSNYKKHIEIRQNYVEHPEDLPTKEAALMSAFWFKHLKADIYWLQAVQYIGSNAIGSEYKKYLFHMIDLVTELDPYFEHPYLIGSLLLPNYSERYEKLTQEEITKYQDQAIELWLKWVENFCPEKEKINKIIEETNLQKIWTEEQFKDPCREFMVPYYLAYIYYFYKNDPLEASKYYKISSANSDSLSGAKVMAAIMQWKWWNREKSFFMFLNMAKYLDSDDNICRDFSINLENLWAEVFLRKSVAYDWKLIKTVEELRQNVFWEFNEENENEILSDAECSNYANKAVRELNLWYIERWNEKFMNNNPTGLPAVNAKELFEEGYIDFLPTDFQQYKWKWENDDYWIIYEYNYDTKNFDYSMWRYN